MAYELREGSGSLFKNGKREEGSNQPNARGDCKIGGVVYEISAWTKESKLGIKFQSLSFKVKEERPAPQRREREPKNAPANPDEPF